MDKLLEKGKKILDEILDNQVSVVTLFCGFGGIIAIRAFIKGFVALSSYTGIGIFIDWLHELFFFGLIFGLIWILLSIILKTNIAKLSGVILWSSLFVIFPPVLDIIRTGGSIYWSFYLLGSAKELWGEYITLFGNLPSGIVYFGTKIVFLLVIVLIFGMVYLKTKKLTRALISAVGTYTIFFAMGAFPSLFAFAYYFFERTIPLGKVNAVDVVQLFGGMARIFGVEFTDFRYAMAYEINIVFFALFLALLAVIFFLADKGKFVAFLKNVRLPQIIYHAGLFFIGMGLGFLAYRDNFNLNVFSAIAVIDLVSAIWLAWLASVVVNDIYDFKIDEISNPGRPLPEKIFNKPEYIELGFMLFALSILGGLAVDLKFAGLLLIYQFIAWMYSAKPYHLKRFPIIATGVSAIASLMVLFMGFALFSGSQNMRGLSWRIIALLLIALVLSLPLKDLKDIEGDKKEGIWTIPVLFGEYWGRIIVASGMFISFILSVFLLNEFRLFWWALFFGGINFLIVTNKKIKPRQLFWWVLAVVAIYGLILVKIVFLK